MIGSLKSGPHPDTTDAEHAVEGSSTTRDEVGERLKNEPISIRLAREWLPLAITFLSVVTALWFYKSLPEQVPVHWGIEGQPDGFSSRDWASLFPPVVIAFLAGLFVFLPSIEPKRGKVIASWRSYRWIRGGILTFLWWTQLLTLQAAISPGFALDSSRLLLGLGVLFMIIGQGLDEIPSNFMVGIRTPWTLSSEAVWRKTHRLGHFTFLGGGLALVFSSLLVPGDVLMYMFMGLLMGMVLLPVVGSYLFWRKERGV